MQDGKGDPVTCSGAMQTRDVRGSHAGERNKKKTGLCRGGPHVEEGAGFIGFVGWAGLHGLMIVGPYEWVLKMDKMGLNLGF